LGRVSAGSVPQGRPRNDAACAACHSAASIETKHLTVNATPNNPNVATGLVNFEYIISSVTVTNNKPVITFKIRKDGADVALEAYSAGTNSTQMISGFTVGPSFLIAYADGTQSTIDYNNLGKAAAKPSSINLIDVWKGSKGTFVNNNDGTYTATLTDVAAAFPAGAKMRTIAMQSYFTPKAGTNGIAADTARHAKSAVKTVTGDTVRREVVDPAKCRSCHEWFEGHGGSRVIGQGTTGTIVCVLCHNPNLTSSGRGANVAAMAQAEKDKLTAAASNHSQDMIHGIHASHKRETKYDFVRDRNNGLYYDWSHVTFPAKLNNCETCHKPGTYGAVPAGALSTTDLIGGDATTTSAVKTLRGSVPNASDRITSPNASTCIMCHDGAMPKTHIEQRRRIYKGEARSIE